MDGQRATHGRGARLAPAQHRPAWLDLVDCPDPRTGVRASIRVWRGVLRELGVSRFEEMPADRAELPAVVDRVHAARPPATRGRRRPPAG